MTKQDILDYFKYINAMYNECTRYDDLSRMIDELQEPCTDAISRQAVIEVIKKCHCEEWVKADIGAPIEALQSVTPTEKVGRWISNAEDDLKISEYTCSNCKGLSDEDSDFCPKCGSYNGGVK